MKGLRAGLVGLIISVTAITAGAAVGWRSVRHMDDVQRQGDGTGQQVLRQAMRAHRCSEGTAG